MKKKHIITSSVVVGGVVALLLFLRPSPSGRGDFRLAVPERIPAAARAVIRTKMREHAAQLPALLSTTVALDYDGVARVAGQIFDEPQLARPITGDELNGLLPPRFFVLQDALRAEARRVVAAAARKDSVELANAFGELTKTCIACHDVYLRGAD